MTFIYYFPVWLYLPEHKSNWSASAQSTYRADFSAHKAIDGDLSIQQDSLYHSRYLGRRAHDWLQIDFGESQTVVEVHAILRRVVWHRVRDLQARVGDTAATTAANSADVLITDNPLCGEVRDTVTEHAHVFRCQEPLTGRYLLLQLNWDFTGDDQNLEIDEVDVVVLEEIENSN